MRPRKLSVNGQISEIFKIIYSLKNTPSYLANQVCIYSLTLQNNRQSLSFKYLKYLFSFDNHKIAANLFKEGFYFQPKSNWILPTAQQNDECYWLLSLGSKGESRVLITGMSCLTVLRALKYDPWIVLFILF